MALKLSLKPGEKFVVNGAVIANGDRRTSLVIQNKVSILRERDILKEEEVDTPVKRIYFPIMLCYLDPQNKDPYLKEFMLRLSELMQVVEDPDAKQKCVQISNEVMKGNYYKALMVCKKLFPYEKERLEYVP
ncbi:flagellar biosynthesis repressor FlbT [Rhodothalassium salexigens]|uniref:Flagellar protein FlbT n=1 Tax=Rhodothalassium salexigens DSM 2132 TaxID=1188247 RepID=A0A4R2P816_RHOSA|nr:flagellar biosynthesis repressor FlbT [Rhodothalassium salexigens]MBK1640137.1 flagellar biosynthesis repressor FlbT [Rhodothalassium salexigens DSM 2132]MBK5911101.1 flagellar biosynthesis repressor FlbT [Rhodothalassium salexigens]MBK5921751.1 flagellar biosynthesis repressor FlbT [Rhodothalassium salexigens]TCP30151.1 flagellar protein FlbT [Rhodothalassium salexigens DSM 2132]